MTLKEVIPNWLNNGVFSKLILLIDWGTVTSKPLDIAYMSRSSNKQISPIVENFLVDNVLSDEALTELCESMYTIFGESWERLWDALQEEYNAIHNYNMTETKTPRVKTTTKTDGLSKVYGFNSNVGVPSDSSDTSVSTSFEGDDKVERSGNIGVTTSQQMLESEFELRKKHYFTTIFKDVDSFLTLRIY